MHVQRTDSVPSEEDSSTGSVLQFSTDNRRYAELAVREYERKGGLY